MININKYVTTALATAIFLTSATTAIAAPWTPAEKYAVDDKYVAYYAEGRHAIPGESNDQYYGRDLVMARGNSGQFHQWFEGTDPNGMYVAIHSVWNLAHNGKCPNNWITIPNASSQWGDYLESGATYCVNNNYYQGTK